jgi:hypothetical protein
MVFRFSSMGSVKISSIASHVMMKDIFHIRYGIQTTVQHVPVQKVCFYHLCTACNLTVDDSGLPFAWCLD